MTGKKQKEKQEVAVERYINDRCYGVVAFIESRWVKLDKGPFRCAVCGEDLSDFGYYVLRDKKLMCPEHYSRYMDDAEKFTSKEIIKREDAAWEEIVSLFELKQKEKEERLRQQQNEKSKSKKEPQNKK